MTALEFLLSRCREFGVAFSIQPGGTLHVKAATPLPDDLKHELRLYKDALLKLLTNDRREFLPDSWDNLTRFMLGLWTEHPECFHAICSTEDAINALERHGVISGEEYEQALDTLVRHFRTAVKLTRSEQKSVLQ